MKFLIIVDDDETNMNELQIIVPNCFSFPVVRELFVTSDGTPVYLSKSEVDALQHAACYEAFENIKKRHEQGIFDILKEAKKDGV